MTKKLREHSRPRAGSGARQQNARGGPPPPRALLGLLAAILLLSALGWWASHRSPARPGAGAAARVLPMPLDSVAPAARMYEAATARGDWPEALRWQVRIAAALPTNPIALRQLGQALHNHRNAITLPDGQTRWLLRNSLVRAEWEARALALFDSSATVAATPGDRALAHYWKGRTAEYEGLPLDALAEYEAALAIVPGDSSMRRACDLARQRLAADERGPATAPATPGH